MTVKLINGDCIEEMRKLIDDDVKVDLVLTDPPYGVTANKWDNPINFDEMWDCIKGLTYTHVPIVLFGTEPYSTKLRMSNIKWYKYDWIWEKDVHASFGIAKYQPLRYHERISVFSNGGGKTHYYPQMIKRKDRRIENGQKNNHFFKTGHNEGIMNGAKDIENPASKYDPDWKYPSSVLKFNRIRGNSRENVPHPSQKPLKLLSYLIKTYTKENDTVLDFTMGSGSTGVACQKLNRNFIGIELDEKYYNIAKERITNYQTKLVI